MNNPTPDMAAPNLLSDAASLEAAAEQAIAACGGDAREAVKALLIANEFLEAEFGLCTPEIWSHTKRKRSRN